MIRLTQLKLKPCAGEDLLEKAIRKALHLNRDDAFSYEVLRRSIDARKKPALSEIYTVLVDLKDQQAEKRILRAGLKHAEAYQPAVYRYARVQEESSQSENCPEELHGSKTSIHEPGTKLTDPDRPLIVGTGPAGLFCGLLLARAGRRPILIERGQRAKERSRSVQLFWDKGSLNPESNVQFGEGGAGTFSDGKLNTGVKDPDGRIRFILETFVSAGAGDEILYSSRPHVGTDVLKEVVTNLTDEICFRGGAVFFETRMDRMRRGPDGIWQVSCTRVGGESLSFSTRHLVLAIGHSSRDTFEMLKDTGIEMHPKSFAVGIRIQHPQEMINRALYGESPEYQLPAASYKLTHRLPQGRGVYSFCMCPGGYVVNASSESGHLAVNGMSFHDRASSCANSAIVVTVSPEEIAEDLRISEETDPRPEFGALQRAGSKEQVLIGMEFQRKLEKAAWKAGGGAIPAQRFGDFALAGSQGSLRLPDYEPQIMGNWKMADLRPVFPERILKGIEEGILAWERQIKGFSSPDALLCAAESRTSSPVRIERGADLQAIGHPGLYPCGEGAGYAGGITSAAADGLRVAEQILKGSIYRPAAQPPAKSPRRAP